MTNEHQQVADPDGFDDRTYRLAGFAPNKKLVRAKTDERALATEGAQ